MAGLIFLGILGTGQFSAWFELIIVVFVVARTEGQMRQLLEVARARPHSSVRSSRGR